MAQLNDLIVNGYTRFLNSAYGNLNGSATSALCAANVPDSVVTSKDIVKAGYYLTSSNKNTLGIIHEGCSAQTANGSLALGKNCLATGSGNTFAQASFSFGDSNRVSGINSIAVGRVNWVSGSFNAALGYSNIIYDKSYSFTIGGNNNISSDNAGALGWESSAYTEPVKSTNTTFNRSLSSVLPTVYTACSYPSYSTSIYASIQDLFNSRYRPQTENPDIPHVGNYAYNGLLYCGDISTPEQYKLALGKNAVAIGRDSIAAGKNSYTLAPHSFVFAKGGIAYEYGQTVVGTWNSPVEDALFVIGGGYGPDETNSRNNVMEVYRSNVKIFGSLNVSNTIEGLSTSSNQFKWSSGSDNVLRPIAFADATYQAYFNGQPFYSQAVYSPGFGYNPSDRALYNTASNCGVRIGQKTIRLSGRDRDVYSASYSSGWIAGNSTFPYKTPLIGLTDYFTTTANCAADTGPGYAVIQGITDIYMCSNAAIDCTISAFKNWCGTTFNFHNTSTASKSIVIDGKEYYTYYSTYGSGTSTTNTAYKLTVRIGFNNDTSGGNQVGYYINSTKKNVAITCFRNGGSTVQLVYLVSFY